MKILIGTSGWMYKDWGKRFYPQKMNKDFLVFYADEFETVEINSSFYRMPNRKTFFLWHKKTPKNFIFSVKLSQYITHRKRLIIDEKSKTYLKNFLNNAQQLKRKFAMVLVQVPPSFKKNKDRLDRFFQFYFKIVESLKYKPLTSIEFRHSSWFDEEIYDFLHSKNIALVISSSPEYTQVKITANFSYIRMHGSKKYDSRYLNKNLRDLCSKISAFPKKVKKVFVYFNNDYSAYAIGNARYLKKLTNK